MCEVSEKLIAWLDRELPAEDAENVGQHVALCSECRREVENYRQLSENIDLYCCAVLASKPERHSRKRVWRAVFGAAAAAAAAVLLLAMAKPDWYFRTLSSGKLEVTAKIAPKMPAVSAPTIEKIPRAGSNKKTRSRPRPRSESRDEIWSANEAPVYIAIPADALFPPGAFPEGVGFVADVNLRPDGSAQRLRLQPQLVGFQTRGTRP